MSKGLFKIIFIIIVISWVFAAASFLQGCRKIENNKKQKSESINAPIFKEIGVSSKTGKVEERHFYLDKNSKGEVVPVYFDAAEKDEK